MHELVRRFEHREPRYTSYPTADRFVEAFGPDAYRASIARRNVGGLQRPLELYVHLPFCRDSCHFCVCNKIITNNARKAARYLKYLTREIEIQGALFCADRRVARMHWGGGTPTFFEVGELAELWRTIRSHFNLAPGADCTIEVDPRTVDAESVMALRELGFNHITLGIPDFAHAVQLAINRVHDQEHVHSVIEAARRASFTSVNAELIYGLPKQNVTTFEHTLAQVIRASPDRIALYNYVHSPGDFKAQRRIVEDDMPSSDAQQGLFLLALSRFKEAGYLHLGMDYFARVDDELAAAQRQGRLRRDFLGYSAGPECDLVGLGVSAMGALSASYSQNCRRITDYYDRLQRWEVPIARGIELTTDDLLRRAVIHALMCQFTVSREMLQLNYLVDFSVYFAPELTALTAYEEAGLMDLTGDWITVTPEGRHAVRRICKVFDRYLSSRQPCRRSP